MRCACTALEATLLYPGKQDLCIDASMGLHNGLLLEQMCCTDTHSTSEQMAAMPHQS